MHEIQSKLLKLLEGGDLRNATLREIGRLVGDNVHPQIIKHHLSQLEKKGFLYMDNFNKTVRRIKNSNTSSLISLPIVGSASCGYATIFADENIEGFIKISKSMIGSKDIKRLFVIKAIGDSMNRANIDGNNVEEGDFVIVDLNYIKPENNDYVLSTIERCGNIKKFFRDDKNKVIMLLSESTKDYPPICIHFDDFDEYFINGKVIKVIKKPKNANLSYEDVANEL